MRTNSIYAHKTADILRDMGEPWAKIIYGAALAIYYLEKRKKTEKSIDKIIVSCYNTENERMFLMETKAPRVCNKKTTDGERAGKTWENEE
jgi:hypothetical protein